MKNEIILQPLRKNQCQIQEAVNDLGNNGGGRIVLLPGTYLSNPLCLIDNLELCLKKGAILLFNPDPDVYEAVFTRWEGTELYALQPMLFAEDCHNISLTGKGIIDGQGKYWWELYRRIRKGESPREIEACRNNLAAKNAALKTGSGGGGGMETDFLRPPLVQFKNCQNILIKDITFRNSAFWNTHILYSSDVQIQGANFINPPDSPNTDGLDIDSSNNIKISGCFFDVGDDCVCLKSGMDEDGRRIGIPAENIEISNCQMKNGHGGVVFGSESAGGIKNISIKNCQMTGTDRGIRLKTRRGRGGVIENIVIDNISMDKVLCVIIANMFYRCGLSEEEQKTMGSIETLPVSEATPAIRNITIKNLTADNVLGGAGYFCGLPERPIEGIRLQNINITLRDTDELYEPAMDMFHTKTNSKSFICKLVSGIKYENILIRDYTGRKIQPIENF